MLVDVVVAANDDDDTVVGGDIGGRSRREEKDDDDVVVVGCDIICCRRFDGVNDGVFGGGIVYGGIGGDLGCRSSVGGVFLEVVDGVVRHCRPSAPLSSVPSDPL